MTTATEKPKAAPMKPAEAAERYWHLKQAIAGLEGELEEAKQVLLVYFEKHPTKTSVGRVGWKWSGGQLILDQASACARLEELGEKLADFKKRARRSRSLTLLG